MCVPILRSIGWELTKLENMQQLYILFDVTWRKVRRMENRWEHFESGENSGFRVFGDLAKSGWKWRKVGKSEEKWVKVVKTGEKRQKLGKSNGKWRKVVKNGENWGKSGGKWGKVGKSGEK